jgi:murein tripeptide amidase MpaA
MAILYRGTESLLFFPYKFRRRVENGSFCLRANENGVDLNRNWDSRWKPSSKDSIEWDKEQQQYPGPSPFSESETKVFKSLVSEFKPDSFATIHSGTLGDQSLSLFCW